MSRKPSVELALEGSLATKLSRVISALSLAGSFTGANAREVTEKTIMQQEQAPVDNMLQKYQAFAVGGSPATNSQVEATGNDDTNTRDGPPPEQDHFEQEIGVVAEIPSTAVDETSKEEKAHRMFSKVKSSVWKTNRKISSSVDDVQKVADETAQKEVAEDKMINTSQTKIKDKLLALPAVAIGKAASLISLAGSLKSSASKAAVDRSSAKDILVASANKTPDVKAVKAPLDPRKTHPTSPKKSAGARKA